MLFQKKLVPLDRRRGPGRPPRNKQLSAIKHSTLDSSTANEELGEKENTDTKSDVKVDESDNFLVSSIPNGDVEMEHSVKIETDSGGRITRSDSRTSSLRVSKNVVKSDVDSDLDDHNTSNESLNCHVNTRSHDEDDHKHEIFTNRSSPSSTEGIRENNTPDLPNVPSPLPVLPESGSDSVSDSVSEDVPSLTPQIPTPHSLDSGDYPHSVECPTVEESNINSPSIQSPRSCVPSPTPSPVPSESVLKQEESETVFKDEVSETVFKQEEEIKEESVDKQVDEQNQDNMAASSADVLASVDSILSPVNTEEHEETEKCEQILADSSAIASSDLVAEMENEMNNSNEEECDEIDNNSTGDIPSDDNFQDFNSDTTTQEALRATENLAQVIAAADLESSLEQMEESAATTVTTEQIMQHEENVNIASVGSASVPSVEPQPPSDPPNPSPRHPHPSPHNTVSPHHPSPHHPGPSPHHPSPHHTMSPHPTLSPQCIPMSMGQMFSPGQQMNTMPSVSNNRYNNEIDVSQLAGLESPASISSNEMQNTSGDNLQQQQQQQQHHRQQQQQQLTQNTFPDCAQAQPQFTSNVQFNSNYMDTVNHAAMMGNAAYMPIVSSAAINFVPPQNTFTGVLIQQPNQTHRLSHNNTPCPPNVTRQVTAATFGAGGQNSCSLQKLQQLTNGIMEIPDNMTPPPNLTPPPSLNMTPPTSMMRTMTATPIPNQQTSQQQYRQYQRQKSSGSSSGRSKNTNIAMNPNVTFTPNVTIQPGSNMIPRYNIMEGYRMQQQMINPGYITNTSFINTLRQPNLPMQMGLNMNMNPMNMNPINAINPQQHFQQHMQSPQSNNMYTTYGYLNGGLSNTLNMNNVMRR